MYGCKGGQGRSDREIVDGAWGMIYAGVLMAIVCVAVLILEVI